MTYPILRGLAFVSCIFAAAPITAAAQGAFGVTYGSEDCNQDASVLAENDIVCSAVFSETNVWDFLDNLPRRITLEELVTLNPALAIEGYETVLNGITFVRVK